ncbi:hypothetical protein [Solemya velesiana gill symbiont]|uniref:Uncharacterized protein n=1 Tax=Solemya velesiana gill symbiont TaxID=1918948 RepID=A0A1T2KUN9_9GAMM|nr:hypothetical protein [Solemya velesiana gill symbiont]OOZ36567.1 hypothetical protein BOW51_06625 [Solemya velesiana gill symbiont]
MKAQLKPDFCAECGHEVVAGVACDWQPQSCPFLKAERLQHLEMTNRHLEAITVACAQPEEYDAVRGKE